VWHDTEDELQAEIAKLRAAGDDVIRASNTLMLMLVGDLPMTKPALEAALRRALNMRNAWDNIATEAQP
jgi:hypothetical protein